MAQLSSMQRRILTWLLGQVRSAERENPQLLESGFFWAPMWTASGDAREADKARENVWRAYLCRSLERLERRGLITRIKGRKNARTSRVKFTDKGREVTEAMRRQLTEYVIG